MTRGPRPKNAAPRWALTLKMRRLELGELTQEDIAARTGDLISPGTISDLERGRATLDGLPTRRALALARALNWTLPEMQAATGVDFGVVAISDLGQQAHPIFKLQQLLNADPQPDSYAFIAPNPNAPNPPNYGVFFNDSDEMTTAQARSIHPDDMVFLDLSSSTPEEGRVYAIKSGEHVHLRRYTSTPFGHAWVADNASHAAKLIPAEQAQVFGRVYRIVSDRSETPFTN